VAGGGSLISFRALLAAHRSCCTRPCSRPRWVADPLNKLYESDRRSDAARESAQANEALTAFSVRRGRIRIGG
jgi:hypothetical protein